MKLLLFKNTQYSYCLACLLLPTSDPDAKHSCCSPEAAGSESGLPAPLSPSLELIDSVASECVWDSSSKERRLGNEPVCTLAT